jgi:hypothetical protein
MEHKSALKHCIYYPFFLLAPAILELFSFQLTDSGREEARGHIEDEHNENCL